MQSSELFNLSTLLDRWEIAVEGTSLPQPPVFEGPDVGLGDLVEHTDYVKPGSCFVARIRTGTDGHPFIGKAITAGASLIVGQRHRGELDVDFGTVPYLQVEDSALAEAWLAAAMYRFPSQDLVMIGITGTDGKTTTSNLIYQILKSAGVRVGMLSTIKASIGDEDEPLALHVTTPEAPVVQRYLRRMVDGGITHCVLEVTSHSLAQQRVAAIDFDVAAVTNITHEHLDYHGDFERYFAAKARLFQALDGPVWNLRNDGGVKSRFQKTAIFNRDDESYARLSRLVETRQMTYGLHGDCDVSAGDITYASDRTSFNIEIPNSDSPGYPVQAELVGEFNVYNMLAASGVSSVLGLSPEAIGEGLDAVDPLSGRMERINQGQDFHVIVDFAHTPNGLERAIGAARSMTTGRIITLFGSAGKRDVAKRILMAEISARDADVTILTAEDPRTESLDAIMTMMAGGCEKQGGIEGEDFWRIRDRGVAIHFALSLAQDKDLVLICGKGHEQSMCFGTTEYPWDDRQATRQAYEALLEGKPMVDLGLPTFVDSS